MNKQLVSALLASSALASLGGCSEGDQATIIIEAPAADSPAPAPAPAPEPEPEPSSECPEGTTEDANGLCELPATISSDMTLDAEREYILSGRVTVGNGNGELGADGNLIDGTPVQSVTLTMPAGTRLYGKANTFANLVITRGSKIMAMGTADAPIVMSGEDEGLDGSGEWGGLIIHGYGNHNECPAEPGPCNIDSEGESGFAGGYDASDNSGILQYVVVAEGGYEFSEGNEINGISLIGVGSGTTMEYIQVEGNSDDGIEFYGGSVNLKYGVFTNNLDDSVDWDEGYQGNLQYIIVKQSPTGSGEAFEMDTQGAASPLSKPTLSNVTIIADKRVDDDPYILNFKKGSGGFFHNTVVSVAPENATPINQCINVNGADSEGLIGTALVLNNWIQDCAAAAGDRGTLANVDMSAGALNINAVAAQLDNNVASQAPEAILDTAMDWAAVNASLPESTADAEFLDSVRFMGAVNPTSTSLPWWAGWTIDGSVGDPSAPEASCPATTTEQADGKCLLPPTIVSDLTLNGGVDYLMEGRVTVGNGNGEIQADGNLADGSSVRDVTLTIEPGVNIFGKSGTFANMVITRGSKIMAEGTKSAPIIFSSDDDGYDGAGEWGGLIIHGYGLHNECPADPGPCNIDSEGESGFAGGYDELDNSGVLKYVVVAEGGYEFSEGNEINGISLVAVGSGTTMDYIQVEGNSDDGIEFYGGNVNVKHGVFTNNLDDSVDWDEGFQGNLQYIIVKQSPNGSGEAFEMDTQGAAAPLSKPTLSNVTIVADKREADDPYILNFKKGSGGFFHNTLVAVASGNSTPINQCVNVNGADSEGLIGSALVLNNWVYDCAADETQGTLANIDVSAGAVNVLPVEADLGSLYESRSPEAVAAEATINWTDINGAYAESTADPDFFDEAPFVGAVNPDGSDPWWAGWTISGSL